MIDDVVRISERPRSIRAHAQVLAATADILAREGFRAVTIERIARESGVSTATIYKHWPSKTAVAAEAFGKMARDSIRSTTTDDPVQDLIDIAVRTVTFYARDGSGSVFRELLAGCALEPAGAAYFRTYFLQPRREWLAPVWARAAEAGLVRADITPDHAMDVLFGPAVFALLTHPGPVTDEQAAELVTSALRGIAA